MKIEDIKIRFKDNERPEVFVTYDKPIDQATPVYIAAKDKEHDCWVYRGEDDEYIHCGVEVRPPGMKMKQDRVKMLDGWHPVWPLQNTNSVAVNALMRMVSPVMDAWVAKVPGLDEYSAGHASATAMARYLWASQVSDVGGVRPAMACVEWPSGIRVYEPVQAWQDEAGVWDAKVNRDTDTFRFLVTPGDGLSPILVAIDAMKNN